MTTKAKMDIDKNADEKLPVHSAILPTKGAPARIITKPIMFTKPMAAPPLPGNKATALLNNAA